MHMTPPAILGAAVRFAVAALLLISGFASLADEPPPGKIRVTWQIRGLFYPEREKDFRALFAENLPEVRVVDVDVPNAEATFELDQAAAFGANFRNAKPEALLGLFNGKFPRKPPSNFSLHARRTAPLEKRCWIEIPFEGLDCEECAYHVYRIIMDTEGVEQATANYRTGLATALIAPETFDERALRRKLVGRNIGVTIFEHFGGHIRREGTMDGVWRRWPAVSHGQAASTTPAPPADVDRQQWTPPEFAAIPAGSYQRGDDTREIFDGPYRVVQTVTLGAYSMATTATTKSQWDALRRWAATHGYADLAEGTGRAGDHPIHSVSWYDVVKWCNAASERDGLKPCYTVDGTVYRTGVSDAVACDWRADGYRLPTEAEWEVAARGGLRGKRFPWGDTISHAQANYIASPNMAFAQNIKLAYDLSGNTAGHHPRFAVVGAAGTSPVKNFTPNDYGLFDMTGNVSQWCWDWFGRYGKEPATDPKGPAEFDWGPAFSKPAKGAGVEGALRILRGGHWNQTAERAACAFRLTAFPKLASTNVGFRLVRGGSAGKPGGSLSQP